QAARQGREAAFRKARRSKARLPVSWGRTRGVASRSCKSYFIGLPPRDSRFQELPSDFHLGIPDSKFKIPDSKSCHQTSTSGFQIPNSRFQISDSKFEELRTIFRCHQTSVSGFQIPNSRFQISDSKFQELPSDFH